MRHEASSGGAGDPSKNYRVTWTTLTEDTNEYGVACNVQSHFHERIFTNIDQGYDFYKDLQKGSSRTYGATWEHIPAQEKR